MRSNQSIQICNREGFSAQEVAPIFYQIKYVMGTLQFWSFFNVA